MTSEIIKWMLGAFGSAVVVGLGGVVSMMRVSFRMGEVMHQLARLSEDVRAMKVSVERIPVHEAKLESIENRIDRNSINGHAEE